MTFGSTGGARLGFRPQACVLRGPRSLQQYQNKKVKFQKKEDDFLLLISASGAGVAYPAATHGKKDRCF